MVLAGQYLERPTLIPRIAATASDPGLTLEGLYHRGPRAPAVVVCAPHPRLGGSMDSPVVAELAWALTRRGRATLRFNYQGVAASEGVVRAGPPFADASAPQSLSTLAEEVADAAAAVRHLAACTEHGRVALAGYSFGAAVALALALEHPGISDLLLIAPPTALFAFDRLAGLGRPVFVAAGQNDPLTDRNVLRALLDGVPGSHLELVAGADHVFSRGLTELGHAAGDWLDR